MKLLIRGSRTTATRSALSSVDRRPSSSRASSESSHRSGLQGSTPSTGRPVVRAIIDLVVFPREDDGSYDPQSEQLLSAGPRSQDNKLSPDGAG